MRVLDHMILFPAVRKARGDRTLGVRALVSSFRFLETSGCSKEELLKSGVLVSGSSSEQGIGFKV